MTRQPNTHGGGANANLNGYHYEQDTSLLPVLERCKFFVKPMHTGNTAYEVYKGDNLLGYLAVGQRLYIDILRPRGVDESKIISRKWRPDGCFINIKTETVFIIEKKTQNNSGSVDEKLATGDFKKWEYQRLFNALNNKLKSNYQVKFIFLLDNYFYEHKDRYKDYFEYIKKTGCEYYFNEMPLDILQLE